MSTLNIYRGIYFRVTLKGNSHVTASTYAEHLDINMHIHLHAKGENLWLSSTLPSQQQKRQYMDIDGMIPGYFRS